MSVTGGSLTLQGLTFQNFHGEWAPKLLAQRKRIITKVWATWIDGVLAKSLHAALPFDLKLASTRSMIAPPMDAYVQPSGVQSLARSSGIADVFGAAGGSLLVLGSPGAGKTTLLLLLAQELLNRAGKSPDQHIPVVFPLSAWEHNQDFEGWLVDRLVDLYGVTRRLAIEWVSDDSIMPFLDGLDEVNPKLQLECAKRIGAFKEKHGLGGLVVSCRIADYEKLGERLPFGGAVHVQPLGEEQIRECLQKFGPERVQGVWEAIGATPDLEELLGTPFWLSLFIASPVSEQTFAACSVEERRSRLMAGYIDQLFRHRRKLSEAARRQLERSLTWLARQMVARGLGAFTKGELDSGEDSRDPRGISWLPLDRQGQLDRYVKITFRVGLAFYLMFATACGIGTAYALGLTAARLALLSAGAAASAAGIAVLVRLFTGLGDFLAHAADVERRKRMYVYAAGATSAVLMVAVVSGLIGAVSVSLIAQSPWVGFGLCVGVYAGTLSGFMVSLGGISKSSSVPILAAGATALSWAHHWNWSKLIGLGLLLGWAVAATGGLLGGLMAGEKNVHNGRTWGFGSPLRNIWLRLLLARGSWPTCQLGAPVSAFTMDGRGAALPFSDRGNETTAQAHHRRKSWHSI